MKIDWQMLVLRLRGVMPCTKISRLCGRHKLWAAQISRGEIGEPRFSDGLMLLDIAYDHLPIETLRSCIRR